MNKLSRQVRFSINPFLQTDDSGDNSFASRPCGQGMAMFLELTVALVGELEPSTGFVVNVVDIDKQVRQAVVPVFAERIKGAFRNKKHVGLSELSELLKLSYKQLKDKFGGAMVLELSLALNPFRKLSVDCEDWKMVYFSEKFEFAAMHKLWNDEFSDERNFEVFGKCANPTGHGHNYVVEVAVKMPADRQFGIGDFERTVNKELIELIDHKNLNADIEYFNKAIPTVENISIFAWNKLVEKFKDATLHCITIWETDRTSCSYYG